MIATAATKYLYFQRLREPAQFLESNHGCIIGGIAVNLVAQKLVESGGLLMEEGGRYTLTRR